MTGRGVLIGNADCEAGVAVVQAIAREGARLCLHGGSAASLAPAREAAAAAGCAAPELYFGMGAREAVAAAQAGGPVHVAISVLPPLPAGRLSGLADGDAALRSGWTHVTASAELFQAALPAMTKRGEGRLIFVGPVEAKAMTGRDADVERAVGIGVLGMMKALSGEVGPHAVTCNSLLWDSLPIGEGRVRILDGLGAGAAYFASPLSEFLTGLVIAVDEGRQGGVF